MKRLGMLLFLTFAVSGCLHTTEHLTINADGSGTVETHLKVHAATMQMLDQMFGGMMQAFASMGQPAEGGKAQAAPPTSVAEQMFSDKEQILKKFRESGVTADFESFSSEKKDDGLYVDYKVKVSDVLKLSTGEGLGTKVRIMRNADGDWFCRLIADKKKYKESKDQELQLEQFKKTAQFQNMPADAQQKMANSFMDLRIEFEVTFPSPVTGMSGMFEKVDDKTSKVAFGMNDMMDPQALAKLASSAKDQMVRTGTGSVPVGFFTPAPGEEQDEGEAGGGEKGVQPPLAKASEPAVPAVIEASAGAVKVKVFLKSGNVVEGRLIEKNEGSVKINFEGVPVTYYSDEIERTE